VVFMRTHTLTAERGGQDNRLWGWLRLTLSSRRHSVWSNVAPHLRGTTQVRQVG